MPRLAAFALPMFAALPLHDAQHIADVQLRVGGQALPLRAIKVNAPEELAQITAAFREKYGLMYRRAGVVRGTPAIFRLAPR